MEEEEGGEEEWKEGENKRGRLEDKERQILTCGNG